jgi:predicted dehydrogenase
MVSSFKAKSTNFMLTTSTRSSEPLRVVIVGCGGITAAWFNAMKERTDARLVGLVDLNIEAAAARQKEFNLTDVLIGSDVEEMLTQLKPDVVFDCTVPVARKKIVETALRHGCHVLSEKPMANTMAEARELLGAAHKADRTFAVMQNRRYLPAIRSFQKFLNEGGVGQLTTLNSDFYIGPHFDGFRDQMKHVLLLDMAVHSFDQARFISGASPVSVYCHEWNPPGSWYAHDASAVAIFQMSNGLVYTYRGSWCSKGCDTTWECDWRAIGTGGSVLWDGGDKFRAEKVTSTEGWIHPVTPVEVSPIASGRLEGHAGCIDHFLNCLKTGANPETVCTDNIKSLAMTFAAIESAETGQVVKIEV